MVRRRLEPGCLDQVLAAQQKSGALRSAQAFAPAIANEGCAGSEMDIGDGKVFRRRVYEDGNVPALWRPGRC